MVETTADESSEDKSEKDAKTPLISVQKIKPDLRKKEPPLVDVKITNPITYIKSWWKRIIGNEGIDIRIRIRPLTAIAISIIVLTISFGIGRFVLPFKIPFFEYTVPSTQTPTSETTRLTAFMGELRQSRDNYYLLTTSSEAINLEVPDNIDFEGLVGERIFAKGVFNPDKRTLIVKRPEDLEILPEEAVPVPTTSPTPTTNPPPTASPQQTEEPEPTVSTQSAN